jgi:hypothetical protein
MAAGKTMTDIRQTAAALIEEYGEEAAAYAIDRITEAYDAGSMYELSVWREIRKAIADLMSEAGSTSESGDDR